MESNNINRGKNYCYQNVCTFFDMLTRFKCIWNKLFFISLLERAFKSIFLKGEQVELLFSCWLLPQKTQMIYRSRFTHVKKIELDWLVSLQQKEYFIVEPGQTVSNSTFPLSSPPFFWRWLLFFYLFSQLGSLFLSNHVNINY